MKIIFCERSNQIEKNKTIITSKMHLLIIELYILMKFDFKYC